MAKLNNQKKQEVERSGFNPVAAAVTGAIVGAGIAIAGTVALENKKNRKEIKQVFTNIKDQAMGYMEKIQKEIKGKKGKMVTGKIVGLKKT